MSRLGLAQPALVSTWHPTDQALKPSYRKVAEQLKEAQLTRRDVTGRHRGGWEVREYHPQK
jgi:hypothetical protein